MPAASAPFDRWVLGAAVVLTAVLFTTQAADAVNVIKMTALILCTLALVVGVLLRTLRTRVAHLPTGLPVVAALALLVAFAVAALTAPVLTTGILGAYGRNSGLLVYGCALLLFLGGLVALRGGGARVVLYAFVLAGSFTASYGLLQYAGVDAIAWNNPFNPIIAALGNPNFAAAYLAICTPAAAWGALRTDWALPWRVASGSLAILFLLAALLTGASQGPLAAAPGLAVLAVAWLLDRSPSLRRAGLLAVGLGTTLGLTVLGLGIAGIGPATRLFTDIGSRARGWYWQAALDVWRDNPVVGAGLDSFGSFWRQVRPLEATQDRGGEGFTDVAHSVPLQLLATGGLVLGLTYLLFVALTAVALISGLRRLQGQERLLLGAVGGCWAAYQVQSFVSIDQVPLIVAHYVLASAVIAVAGWAHVREVRLPGALPPPAPVDPRDKRGALTQPKMRELTAVDYAGAAVVLVLVLGLAWQSFLPLRANTAVLDGDVALAQGDGLGAFAGYDKAADLLAGETRYWQKKGAFYLQAEQPQFALQAYERAVEVDPLDLNSLRTAARVADETGQVDKARAWYQRAVALDPTGPTTTVAAAAFEIAHDDPERARELLEGLLEILPERADAWARLGDARAALGDDATAREAYARALELQPDEPVATAGLKQLGTSAA